MAKEYNELVDRYNNPIDDKAEWERKHREKAYVYHIFYKLKVV